MVSDGHDPIVYSIGHSHHDVETFIGLLRCHSIASVVDVRSQPYSRWVPAFNRKMLTRSLTESGVSYMFMGDSLGGRPADPSLYAGGQAEGILDYDRLMATPGFRAGIQRLLELAREGRVAIMCSEGDFRHCHRHLLIAPALRQQGVVVIHITPDGGTVTDEPELRQLELL